MLGTFNYNAPNDDDISAIVALGFFGVTSSESFNKIVINDLAGNIDNDFFTGFLLSKELMPVTGVPEPATLALLGLGLGLTGLAALRRRRTR